MNQNISIKAKQPVTVFIDPTLLKITKVSESLEGLTISQVVERSLETYTPSIKENSGKHSKRKFAHKPKIDILIPKDMTNTAYRII